VSSQGNTPLAQRRIIARRLIVGGVIVLCVALLSLYGREARSGPLHGLQNAAGTVVTPIQDGASRAVQPVRNAWNWTTSLVNARDRADQLSKQNQALRSQLAQSQFNAEEAPRLSALTGLGNEWRADYAQVPAEIIGRSASPYYEEARISVGTSNGVVVNSPVIGNSGTGAGLVGVVTQAGPISAVVSFISEPQTSVGVSIVGAGGAIGLLQPTAPGAFQVAGIPVSYPVNYGDLVVTAGFAQLGQLSVYPRGIPVGVVSGVGHSETSVDQTVQLTPIVNTDSLAYVVALAPKSALARQRASTP
jgi:rod shape-determining protein MreC